MELMLIDDEVNDGEGIEEWGVERQEQAKRRRFAKRLY